MPESQSPHISPNERKQQFLTLLEPVHDNLARFARSITENKETARDLVGETVLRALEKFDELHDRKAFLSWLFTIAVRLNQRRRKRQEVFVEYNEVEVALYQSHSPSPEQQHDIDVLYKAVGQLRAKEKEAILLFEIAGLSLEEIQKIQGGSLSGVKSRLSRARKKLARLLGVDSDGKMGEESTPPPTHKKNSTIRNHDTEPFIYAGAQSHD